jgi:outer membrane protein
MYFRETVKAVLLTCLLIRAEVVPAFERQYSSSCHSHWQILAGVIANGERRLISKLVQTAWQCNHDILAFAEEIEAREAGVRQSRASLLPRATMNARYEDSSYELAEGYDDTLRQRNAVLQGSLRIPLFRPQEMQALDVSRIERQDAKLALQQQRNELALAIIERVLDMIATLDEISVLEAQVSSLQEQVYINRRRLEGGLGSITDVSETGLRLKLAQTQVKSRRSDLHQQRIDLARLIGKKGLNFENLKIASELPLIAKESIEHATAIMLADNLHLQRMQNQVVLADANIRVQSKGHWPTVELVATRTGNRYFRSAQDSDANVWSNSYVLQLELPIYNGGEVSALEEEALAESRKIRQELFSEQRSAEAEINQYYEALELHRYQMEMHKQAKAEAKRLVKITRKAFQAGNRSNIDVLNAQQQLRDVGGELIQSQVDYLRSQAQIFLLLGRLGEIKSIRHFDLAVIINPAP